MLLAGFESSYYSKQEYETKIWISFLDGVRLLRKIKLLWEKYAEIQRHA